MVKPEVGFIGAGNMGGALINVIKKKYDVYVSRRNIEELKKMKGIMP